MAESNGKINFEKLNNKNYFNWKYRMELFLKRHKLWSVLNIEKPALLGDGSNAEAIEKWEDRDETAHSWICSWVDDSQLGHVRRTKTAKEAWTELKTYHEKDTISNKVSIIRRICNTKLAEGGNMEEHISTLSDYFQKLSDLGDAISDSWSVGMLLSSLPLSYDILIIALESRPEADLTLSLVQEKLTAEYHRRNEQEDQCDDAALKISNEKACFLSNDKACFFCKKNGHIKKNCRKFKHWLFENENKANEGKAKMVGQNEDDYLFMISPKRSTNWVVDSGATCHIANDKKAFVTLNKIEHHLTVADGRQVHVKGKGTCRIELVNENGDKKTALITDVLYIPEIEGNLLSVKKMIDKKLRGTFQEE